MSLNSTLTSQSPCLMVESISTAFTAYTVTTILLLLPLCVLVLHHGLQRCSSPAASPATHSDSFTYHLVSMEIVFVCGCITCCCGSYMSDFHTITVGTYFLYFPWFGETFFQTLTCVEHYLAVVHPITYVSLREERWIRIRHGITGCGWLFCFAGTTLITITNLSSVVRLCVLVSSLIIVSFCSLSVLCVLIRPGPGRRDRNRMQVDQSKLRAFYTIAAILGVLLLRCAWNVLLTVLHVVNVQDAGCVASLCELWMRIPSTLVLPLLFLQRSGVLAGCRNIK